MVHGTMDRASSLRKVVRRLPDLDCTVYDRRGYGGSIDAGTADTITAHVDDLLAVVGDVPAVVFGHSLGGVVALAAAARRPDVVPAVVAYEAPLSWVSWWPRSSAGSRAVHDHGDDPGGAAEAFMRRMIGDELWQRLPARTRAARRAEGPALLAEMAALRTAAAPFRPDDVHVPVVVARGTESAAHHRRGAEELAAVLPDAVLVDLDGAGHGAHLTHPGAVADLIHRAVPRPAITRLAPS
nr:alpha/beta hydrolase [Rhabdothermincola salaria]